VEWSEVFIVFVISHLVGDYLLQTDWQALNKRAGLSRNASESRRALFAHVTTYTLAYGFALVWIGYETSALAALALVPIIFIPHLIQDDGRLLLGYMHQVKQHTGETNPSLFTAVDQSFHMLTLFGTALLVTTF
jgi:Protein of unknown function (DUF3307)